MRRTRSVSLDIDTGKCSGCGRCAAICPDDVFTVRKVDGKMRSVCVWSAKCSGCGRCAVVCPARAIELEVMTSIPELALEY